MRTGWVGVAVVLGVLAGCGTHPPAGPTGTSGPGQSTSSTPSSPPPSTVPPGTSAGGSTGPTSAPPGTPSGTPVTPPVVTGPLAIPPAEQAGPTVTVHGTMQRADTQPSCVVLKTDAGQQFLLTGQLLDKLPRTPEADPAPVLVTGHIAPNQLTHCMLGRPFVADNITYSR